MKRKYAKISELRLFLMQMSCSPVRQVSGCTLCIENNELRKEV